MTTQPKKVIPFFVAGYPSLEFSFDLISSVVEAGATMIELGVPASDPTADGPAIQKAHALALQNGMNLKLTLDFARRLTQKFPNLQIVLFTYLNPIFKMGYSNYARAAKSCKVYATLVVDLPVEEALNGFVQAHNEQKLGMVFLATPTTSQQRLAKINELSQAFIYYVARTGVTGAQTHVTSDFLLKLGVFRHQIDKPLALGFGISTIEQVKGLAPYVDYVVIGSFLVGLIDQSPNLCEAQRGIVDFYKSAVQSL